MRIVLPKRLSLRTLGAMPYFWALLGLPLVPANVILASFFCLFAWHSERERGAAECLNTQLTYTVAFFIPITLAFLLTLIERPGGADFSLPFAWKIATGFPLGMISLSAILLLAFFNVRAVAFYVFGHTFEPAPRVRFVTEPSVAVAV